MKLRLQSQNLEVVLYFVRTEQGPGSSAGFEALLQTREPAEAREKHAFRSETE